MDESRGSRHSFVPLLPSSSLDSDETADNLPGPGRNLGLLYAFLGRKLENRFSSPASCREPGTHVAFFTQPDSHDSIPSVDSNATADNLPGPGRNLGRLYVHLGNKLLNSLGRFLARHGRGPDAIAQTISRLRRHNERDIYDIYSRHAIPLDSGSTPTESDRAQLKKKCKKLVNYARSRAESTAVSACKYISELALYDPFIKQLLHECIPPLDATAFGTLEHCFAETWTGIDVDPLLASSRKALISVTEVASQRIWSEYYVISAHGSLISSNPNEWQSRMGTFYKDLSRWFKALNEEATLSFLSLRHMFHAMQSAMDYVFSFREDENWLGESDYLINTVHMLLAILAGYLNKVLTDDFHAPLIDWDTLESLLGKEGKDAVWAERLLKLSSYEFRNSSHVDRLLKEKYNHIWCGELREELDMIFLYAHAACVDNFSELCRRHNRQWVAPTYDDNW